MYIHTSRATKEVFFPTFSTSLFLSLDIRLDWEVYNIEEDDNQLIDLIIDVGDPFPKMHDGKEIVSDEQINTGLPLITVNVREHKGRHDNTSFRVEKTQMVLVLAS